MEKNQQSEQKGQSVLVRKGKKLVGQIRKNVFFPENMIPTADDNTNDFYIKWKLSVRINYQSWYFLMSQSEIFDDCVEFR